MKIKIRHPDLNIKTDEGGIPQDYYDVMRYFNKALKEKQLNVIPRKNPITEEEIRDKWVRSTSTNLVLLAEAQGKIVGSLTVFHDTKSTSYEHAEQRKVGDIGSTVDPFFPEIGRVRRLLTERLIKELKEGGLRARWTMAKENKWTETMKEVGYKDKGKVLENQKRYKQAGLSGKVIEYSLP